MRRDETDPAALLVPATLVNPDNTPYVGSIAAPTILLNKPGTTTWVPATAVALVAITGGRAGTVALQLDPSEVTVRGTLRYAIDVGAAAHFERSIEIVDAPADVVAGLFATLMNPGAPVGSQRFDDQWRQVFVRLLGNRRGIDGPVFSIDRLDGAGHALEGTVQAGVCTFTKRDGTA